MKTKYEKGDDVWIHVGSTPGKLSKGTVLEVLDLSEHGYSFLNYLIEIQTSIDPILEVREAMTMSEDEKGPIGLFRKMKERHKNEG
jgi:ribosomal protein L24